MSLRKDLSAKLAAVFEKHELDPSLGEVQASDRPDLSDFQCNGAFKAAKVLKQNPRNIAENLKVDCDALDIFEQVRVDGPGFLNFKLKDSYVAKQLAAVETGLPKTDKALKIIMDYGGPNVAKPLHVGHMRTNVIGEALKRMARAKGHEVIADVHFGDWGTPMGMLIAELKERHPQWPYFQEPFQESADTKHPPLSVDELNKLYPEASAHYKSDEEFADKAREATAKLQRGDAGHKALWQHFITLSVGSVKEDLKKLDVDFDLWYGESDADPYVPVIIQDMLDKGVAREDDGALIVDVKEEGDKTDIPPLMLRKRDGSATYATTDIATIYQRVKDFNPDIYWYVVDQRQSLHFLQVFRAAAKAGYVRREQLEHIGFGTMNGKGGKPFKTRDGGVMRLSQLIGQAKEGALKEAGFSGQENLEGDLDAMASDVAMGAIKYGDLMNPRLSDYVFDLDELVRFEGNTGPYIQYAYVRTKAMLEKIDSPKLAAIDGFKHEDERALAIELLAGYDAIDSGIERRMPSDVCTYVYGLARKFSSFYSHCPVASESDEHVRQNRITLTLLTKQMLEVCMDVLGLPKPKHMQRAEQ